MKSYKGRFYDKTEIVNLVCLRLGIPCSQVECVDPALSDDIFNKFVYQYCCTCDWLVDVKDLPVVDVSDEYPLERGALAGVAKLRYVTGDDFCRVVPVSVKMAEWVAPVGEFSSPESMACQRQRYPLLRATVSRPVVVDRVGYLQLYGIDPESTADHAEELWVMRYQHGSEKVLLTIPYLEKILQQFGKNAI